MVDHPEGKTMALENCPFERDMPSWPAHQGVMALADMDVRALAEGVSLDFDAHKQRGRWGIDSQVNQR